MFRPLLLGTMILALAAQSVLAADEKSDVPVLIKQLADKDEAVRFKAAKTLAKLGPAAKDAGAALKETAAKDEDADVKSAAKKALTAIQGSGPEKLDPKIADLIKGLKSRKTAERTAALEALTKMGEEGKPASRVVCEMIVSSVNPKAAQDLLDLLEKVNPAISTQVSTALIDKDYDKRFKAVKELGTLGEDANAATPIVLAHMQIEHKANMLNGPMIVEEIDVLLAIAPNDPDTFKAMIWASSTGERAGKRKKGETTVAAEMAQRIAQFANDHDTYKKQAITVLTGLLRSDDDHGKTAAANALGEFGADAKAAIPVLKVLKGDPSEDVRKSAKAALEKIEQ